MSEIKPFTGVDDRVLLADAIPLIAPFTLNVFASNICNFKCNYCVQSLESSQLKEQYSFNRELMPLEVMEKVVEQSKLFDMPYKLISFMGQGEPLCNRDLPQMISLAKQAGIAKRIDVVTNASLLTPQYSEELIAAGLDVLRVSLQGISAESYFKTCGVKIDFDRFFSNLKYFYSIKKNCKLFVKTMNTTLCIDEEEKFYKMFAKCSDRMYIDEVKPTYAGAGVNYTSEEQNLTIDRHGNSHTHRFVCPQPFYMLTIWPNGDVAPCSALYKASPLGNIFNDKLPSMWRSEKLKEFQKLQLEHKRGFNESCASCCAPDDCIHSEDVLDGVEEKILNYLYSREIKA